MPDAGSTDGGRPSAHAARRLQVGLEAGIASFADEVDADLADVDRAVAAGREDIAVEVLEEHLVRLERFAEQLKLVVAGAAVEREAEAVLARAALELPHPSDVGVTSAPRPSDPRPSARGALSRGVLVAACVALVAVLAVGVRPPAGDPLLAAATASEQALDAARDAATGSVEGLSDLAARSADLHTAISRLDVALLDDPLVRERLQVMLADQQRALAQLSPRLPAVAGLLAELEALARSLDLPLPSLPVRVPDVIDVDDLPLVREPQPAVPLPLPPGSPAGSDGTAPGADVLQLPDPPQPADPALDPAVDIEAPDDSPGPGGEGDGAGGDADAGGPAPGGGDAPASGGDPAPGGEAAPEGGADPTPSEDERLEDLLQPPPAGSGAGRVESAPDALGLP